MNSLRSLISKDVGCETVQAVSPSVLDNLERQKASLEMRLDDINRALNALKANPEVTKVLELLAKVT